MFQKSISRHQLSKSTFMYGLQCSKRIWLHKNLPKERDIQSGARTRIFQQGTDIGVLAQQLFTGGINAEPENYYSYQKSVADTQRYIRNGHQVIYEAAFQYMGILCAVDILVKANNKWFAYEVKSTNSVKTAHFLDSALQYYVITNSGIELSDFNIIHLNRNYIRQGELDIRLLFNPASVLKEIIDLQAFISSASIELIEVLSRKTPPNKKIGKHCNNPYPCDFQMFCNKGVLPAGSRLGDVVNINQLSAFSGNLKYPVSFLSLQTWSVAVPQFDGHFPYKQVCYQYSLDSQKAPGEALTNTYFLEEKMNAGQKELIESLLKSAGENGSIVVHYNSYVNYHLQQFKNQFPHLEKFISSVQKRVIELMTPFEIDTHLEKETKLEFIQSISKNTRSITDSSSAAATFYNMRSEDDEFIREEIRKALYNYSRRSSRDLALKIDHWALF